MTPRKKTSSSSSSLVRVRAEAHVIGVKAGAVLEVERTSFVEALVANGHFTYVDAAPAADVPPNTDDKADDKGEQDSA